MALGHRCRVQGEELLSHQLVAAALAHEHMGLYLHPFLPALGVTWVPALQPHVTDKAGEEATGALCWCFKNLKAQDQPVLQHMGEQATAADLLQPQLSAPPGGTAQGSWLNAVHLPLALPGARTQQQQQQQQQQVADMARHACKTSCEEHA